MALHTPAVFADRNFGLGGAQSSTIYHSDVFFGSARRVQRIKGKRGKQIRGRALNMASFQRMGHITLRLAYIHAGHVPAAIGHGEWVQYETGWNGLDISSTGMGYLE